MNELETHVRTLVEWVKTLDGCPESWSSIQIVEDPLFTYRGKNWEIPRESLKPMSQYEDRFRDLLSKGYSWININFGGIYQGNAVVFVEYPRESSGVPKEKVTVNVSGPEGNVWDLTTKLCVLD